MKTEKRTPYESPQVEILSLRMEGTLLTLSETGESFGTPVDYDIVIGDWQWII